MNDNKALEHRLASAFAVAPVDGFEATDRRIAEVTAHPDPSRPRRWRRVRVGLVLAAAFIVLAGAAAGAVHLLDRVATGTPGTSVAWDQGVKIGQRQVDGDLAVTLARGYADINQVVLALSVERVGGGTGGIDAGFVTELTDPAGVSLAPGGAPSLGANDATGQAEMLTFAPTTSSDGEYTLRLGIRGDGAQPDLAWTFQFTLPAPAGAVVHVAQTKSTDNGSVDLGDVRLSPTMISASLHLKPADDEASGWSAIGYFKHRDQTINVDWGVRRGPSDLDQTAGTYAGTGDPAGPWTLVITELVGERPDGTQSRLAGPWEFSFRAP